MSNVSFGKLSKDLLMGQIDKDIEKGEQIFVTSFTKLSVNGIADLRKNLRQNGAHYRVVKNSLGGRQENADKHDPVGTCHELLLDEGPSGPTKLDHGHFGVLAPREAADRLLRQQLGLEKPGHSRLAGACPHEPE